MRIIPARERNKGTFGWIEIYSLFSFNNYFDPENVLFGNITVFNEYTIPGGFGFPMHPHENMELVFIVLDGQLSFRDQSGQSGLLSPESVICLSCGSGYAHMIHNYGDKPLRLIAIWMLPAGRNTMPSYSTGKFPPSLWENRLCPLVSEAAFPTPHPLATKARSTVFRLGVSGATVRHEMPPDSRGLLYVVNGEGAVDGIPLAAGDHVRFARGLSLAFAATSRFECIFVQMTE